MGRLVLTPPPRWHRAAEILLRVWAFSAVLAIALIFLFVTKQALPLFYDHEVRSEVTPSQMWLSQQLGGLRQARAHLAAGLGRPQIRGLAADRRHRSRWF